MITLISILTVVMAGSTIALMLALFNAPEGYEDEQGFHLTWANNSPDIPDVACVWTCASA